MFKAHFSFELNLQAAYKLNLNPTLDRTTSFARTVSYNQPDVIITKLLSIPGVDELVKELIELVLKILHCDLMNSCKIHYQVLLMI